MSSENKSSENNLHLENDDKEKVGLDAWNDRLDENLETDKNNDPEADKKSKDFFEGNEHLNED